MKITIDLPEKTIAHIRSDYGHGIKNIWHREDMEIIVDEIYRAKKGKWLGIMKKNPFFEDYTPFIKCSECGKEYVWDIDNVELKYCPNCGACMKRGDNNE